MSTDKSIFSQTGRTILKSTSIVSLGILLSRILGFLRDVVIARLFGVYLYAQAFVIAFRIPNLFRDFVGEGATNAVFVPVFSEYTIKHRKEEFWELANVILNLLLVILAGITLLGIIFSPLLVRLIAPGFSADPQKLATTIALNRLIFPYILLISLAAYAMAILNSLQHFAVPAFAPCLLNISIIFFALLFGEGIKGLASGVLIGGVLQLAVQIPVLYKKGFRWKFTPRFDHPAARTIGKLMLPRVFSSCIYQLNNFIDSIFGSLAWIVGEGGVAILYFAYRLILFPLGIFATALAQTILPTFSVQALEDNHEKLKATLSFGLRSVFFVMLPSSVGFMVLSYPIIFTLFAGKKFDLYATKMTAQVLFYYSIGLSSYGAIKILQSCFFSLKDTVTPTKVAALGLVVNIILNSLLMFPLKIGGLALATSISGINTCLILFFILKKRLHPFNAQEIFASFLRILLASLAMGLVCYFLSQQKIILFNKYLGLGLLIVTGLFSYLIFCLIFRVSELRDLLCWMMQKRK